jgi:hypothetical protein
LDCSRCGRALPEGALFCPDCGAPTPTFGQANLSPSHFNTGMTSTAPTSTTSSSPPPPAEEPVFASPPFPDHGKPPRSRRRGLLIAVIIVLAFLLVATTLEAGLLGGLAGPAGPTAPAINSASSPMTGAQLFASYSDSDANKTVYIQDSLYSGLELAIGAGGRYASSIDSGMVVLFWDGQANVGQLSTGETVLAKCSIQGAEDSPEGQMALVFLQDCQLLKVSAQSAPGNSVPAQNL